MDTAKRAILMQTGHGNTPGIPQERNRQMHRLTKIGKEHVFYKKISSNRQNAITDFNLIKSISFKI